jgi:MFS family permease
MTNTKTIPIAPPWALYTPRQRKGFIAVLFLVSASQFFDHSVISVLFEPIKREFHVSDKMLGLLGGFCFSVFYVAVGVPVARWADRGNRRTVISVALMVWSAMTLLSGLSQTFWQLALARVGVGAGESGGIPPAQSLIVDYFPPHQRGMAIAIFTGGQTAGNLLGLAVGGSIAAVYGWRSALLFGGLAGIALAWTVTLTLAEPRMVLGYPRTDPSLKDTLATFLTLWRKRSYRYALIGFVMYFLFVYGTLGFGPSFLIRILHASLGQASVTYGIVAAAGSLVGFLGGGWLVDRLSARDIRWLAWMMAVACAIAGPLYAVAFAVHDLWVFMALAFVGAIVLAAGVPSAFTSIHAVCGGSRRAIAIAMVFFSATLLGGGFGPLLSGALSDTLAQAYGVEGLRYALITMSALAPVSAFAFYCCGKTMPKDLED